MVEPPRAAALAMAACGADFRPVQQIALADDTDKAPARVEDRRAADTALCK